MYYVIYYVGEELKDFLFIFSKRDYSRFPKKLIKTMSFFKLRIWHFNAFVVSCNVQATKRFVNEKKRQQMDLIEMVHFFI